MTPDQLDEIEKLAEAATPGPWRAQLSDKGHALFGPLPNGECGSMRIALSSYAAFDRANMLFAEGMRDAALPLVKALREAWEDRDEARAAATRQTERLMQEEELSDRLHKERDEVRDRAAMAERLLRETCDALQNSVVGRFAVTGEMYVQALPRVEAALNEARAAVDSWESRCAQLKQDLAAAREARDAALAMVEQISHERLCDGWEDIGCGVSGCDICKKAGIK